MKQQSKLILTLSMDGLARDHRRMRRPLAESKETVDSYHHIRSLLPELLRVPRLVITQTIAPATARNAVENFGAFAGIGLSAVQFFFPGILFRGDPSSCSSSSKGSVALARSSRRAGARGSTSMCEISSSEHQRRSLTRA